MIRIWNPEAPPVFSYGVIGTSFVEFIEKRHPLTNAAPGPLVQVGPPCLVNSPVEPLAEARYPATDEDDGAGKHREAQQRGHAAGISKNRSADSSENRSDHYRNDQNGHAVAAIL